MGDPFDAATAQGPQVSSLQFDSVMRYIEAGKREVRVTEHRVTKSNG